MSKLGKLGRGCRLSKLIWYRGLLSRWCIRGSGNQTRVLAAAVLAGNEGIADIADWYGASVREVAASIWFELDRMSDKTRAKKLKQVRLAGLARINDT